MNQITQTKTVRHDADGIHYESTVMPGQESSVEITQNSSGKPRLTVKVYDADPDVALEKAILLYDKWLGMLAIYEL
jgi:hypothetical protein